MTMAMVESSMICQLILGFWVAVTAAWEDSRVVNALRAFGGGVGSAVRGSALCRFLWREGTLSRRWGDSITYMALTVILNIPCAICKWIYKVGKKLWDGSLCFRAASVVCGNTFLLLGLFLAVMLMVPHGNWDNRYALMGALALTALFAIGSGPRASHRLEPGAFGPYYIFFMGFICYAFLSSLDWKPSIRFVGFHLAAFLLAVLVVSSVKKYEQLRLLVVLAVLGLTIAALYGCYQGVTGVKVVANQQDLSVNAGMPGRVYSFFDNPNNFAELLVMLMPFTYALFLNAKSWRGKLAAVFSLGVCGAARLRRQSGVRRRLAGLCPGYSGVHHFLELEAHPASHRSGALLCPAAAGDHI